MEKIRKKIKIVLKINKKIKTPYKLKNIFQLILCQGKQGTRKNLRKKTIYLLLVQQTLLSQQLHCEPYYMQKLQILEMCDVLD